MLTTEEIAALEPMRKYFIESDRDKATFFDWIFSKGTNFTCYVEYLNTLSDETKLNQKINAVRIVIDAMTRIVTFPFFYWTILIFVLHKFNFKKPVMKIILFHFVVRCSGNIMDKFGDFMSHYYANVKESEDEFGITYKCQYNASSSEMNPLKWFLTRQIGTILWYTGEMAADWYPLLRTKAVAKDRSLWYVYASCGLFNFAKLSLIIYHFLLRPDRLYDENGVYRGELVGNFYNYYWIIQMSIICTSLIYDITVFIVLKKRLNEMGNIEFGFIKKFRSISEFRIIISLVVGILFLPILTLTFVLKYYYRKKYNYYNLDFTFEEVRKMIANVQYYMIFIDQILLLRIRDESSVNASNKSSNNVSSSNNYFSKPTVNKSPSSYSSTLYYEKLSNLNLNAEDSTTNLNEFNYGNSEEASVTIVTSPTSLNVNNQFYNRKPSLGMTSVGTNSPNSVNLNNQYFNKNSSSLAMTSSSGTDSPNSFNSQNYRKASLGRSSNGVSNTGVSTRNRSIGNYDDYNGSSNEWNYLRR